jgi:hypothetical protein
LGVWWCMIRRFTRSAQGAALISVRWLLRANWTWCDSRPPPVWAPQACITVVQRVPHTSIMPMQVRGARQRRRQCGSRSHLGARQLVRVCAGGARTGGPGGREPQRSRVALMRCRRDGGGCVRADVGSAPVFERPQMAENRGSCRRWSGPGGGRVDSAAFSVATCFGSAADLHPDVTPTVLTTPFKCPLLQAAPAAAAGSWPCSPRGRSGAARPGEGVGGGTDQVVPRGVVTHPAPRAPRVQGAPAPSGRLSWPGSVCLFRCMLWLGSWSVCVQVGHGQVVPGGGGRVAGGGRWCRWVGPFRPVGVCNHSAHAGWVAVRLCRSGWAWGCARKAPRAAHLHAGLGALHRGFQAPA